MKGLCFFFALINTFDSNNVAISTREIVTVENRRSVRLLDLTADFGVNVDADLSATWESKTGIQSCLCTVTLTPIFGVNFLTFIL